MNKFDYTFDVNRIIEEVGSALRNEKVAYDRRRHHLHYNRYITSTGLLLEFILPGYQEKDISLECLQDTMVVSVTKPNREIDGSIEHQGYQWRDIPPLRVPLSSQQFSQAKITALLKNGILSVKVPFIKAPSGEGAKKITIQKDE